MVEKRRRSTKKKEGARKGERERELKHSGEGKRIGEKRKKEKSKLQNDVFTMKRVDWVEVGGWKEQASKTERKKRARS